MSGCRQNAIISLVTLRLTQLPLGPADASQEASEPRCGWSHVHRRCIRHHQRRCKPRMACSGSLHCQGERPGADDEMCREKVRSKCAEWAVVKAHATASTSDVQMHEAGGSSATLPSAVSVPPADASRSTTPLKRELASLGLQPPSRPPSTASVAAATTASTAPAAFNVSDLLPQRHLQCSICKAADGTYCGFCLDCYPKDEHGNILCITCCDLQCAACGMCNCRLSRWHSAGVSLCDGCQLPFCNVLCSRREDGNHEKHYDYGPSGDGDGENGIDCNAPLGLGCQCPCCKRLNPPLCTSCIRAEAPCEVCWDQWEYVGEIGHRAYTTSKYSEWQKHWQQWCNHRPAEYQQPR